MQVLWIASTHSGEIDYILPLLNHLKKKKIKLKVIFLNHKIFQSFSNTKFYINCFNDFDVKFLYLRFFKRKKLSLLLNFFLLIIYLPIILFNVLFSKYIFFEKSSSTDSSKFFSFLCNIFKKKVLLFPHSVQVFSDIRPQHIKNAFKLHKTFLNHELEKKHYVKELNFKNYELIGHPYLCEEWQSYLNNYFSKYQKQYNKLVTIILGKIYRSENTFYEEIEKICNILYTKDKDININFKVHPSMDEKKIKDKINKLKISFNSFNFTNDHLTECSMKSKLLIIINNSSSWIPALLGKPYIEFASVDYMHIIKAKKTPINEIDNNTTYNIDDFEKEINEIDFETSKKRNIFDEFYFRKDSFYSIFNNN